MGKFGWGGKWGDLKISKPQGNTLGNAKYIGNYGQVSVEPYTIENPQFSCPFCDVLLFLCQLYWLVSVHHISIEGYFTANTCLIYSSTWSNDDHEVTERKATIRTQCSTLFEWKEKFFISQSYIRDWTLVKQWVKIPNGRGGRLRTLTLSLVKSLITTT